MADSPTASSARIAGFLLHGGARGAALFLGSFTLLNLARGATGIGANANSLWLEWPRLPFRSEGALMGLVGVALVACALRPPARQRPVALVTWLLRLCALGALVNAFQVLRLDAVGQVDLDALPLSLAVAVGLMVLAAGIPRPTQYAIRKPSTLGRLGGGAFILGSCGAVAVLFGLLQILCFGSTDYRRDADAIVVLGARAYADGTPSDALRDRVLTACELYHEGRAPRILMSGGPGDGELRECDVMRNLALEQGVADEDILLDPAGFDSRSTVRNTSRILGMDGLETVLVVSHGYHLPRLKMAFDSADLRAYTVPAEQHGGRLAKMPWFVSREIVALWVYYFWSPTSV